MYPETRCTHRFLFVATAEVQGVTCVRSARVSDLSIAGAYLGMPDPFSKGASVRIKIRTKTEFFQADATVIHSTHALGMGVMFQAVSPPFLIVLQRWLSEAQREVTQHT
jgi:hypothetical protein